MTPLSASHKRAAESRSVLSTFGRSYIEGLMMLRTSAVAVSCCRASFSSLVSRATFVSSRAADELLGRATFDVTPLFCAPVLGRSAFAGSPPALDRRRIAAPRLRTRHRGEIQTSTPVDGSSQCVGVTFALGLKKRSFSKTAQMCAAHEQVRRLGRYVRAGGTGRA